MKRMSLHHLHSSESSCDSVPLIEEMNKGFPYGAKGCSYVLYVPGPQSSAPFPPMAGPAIPAVANSCYSGHALSCLLGVPAPVVVPYGFTSIWNPGNNID